MTPAQAREDARRSPEMRALSAWRGACRRCEATRGRDYQNYAGRGIRVAQRWMEFRNFLEDMGAPPPGMTLDRINNDKGYEQGNCRWTTAQVQATNRRGSIWEAADVKRIALRAALGWSTQKIATDLCVKVGFVTGVLSGSSWRMTFIAEKRAAEALLGYRPVAPSMTYDLAYR